MQVVPVKEYNRQQEIKYSQDCQDWTSSQGGFPQAAFYFFSTNRGEFRRTGWVAFDKRSAVLRKTKQAAITAFSYPF